MARLSYHLQNQPVSGKLTGRVLIGRRLPSGVQLDDPSVSRLHAWIDPIDEFKNQWRITDAGSKAGTLVNGQIVHHAVLKDGDDIQTGRSHLRFQADDVIPLGTSPTDLTREDPDAKPSGILFTCSCGSPLWAGLELAGKRGLCRHCRKPVTVPRPERDPEEPGSVSDAASFLPAEPAGAAASGGRPGPAGVADRPVATCGVCHSTIVPADDEIVCPDCAIHYHAGCWQENLGCSSYGCPQVEALKPVDRPDSKSDLGPDGTALEAAEMSAPAGNYREWVALAGSVLAVALGALAFGLPALVAAAINVSILRKKGRQKAIRVVALLICIIGIFLGLWASDLQYFNGRHFHRWLAGR